MPQLYAQLFGQISGLTIETLCAAYVHIKRYCKTTKGVENDNSSPLWKDYNTGFLVYKNGK